MPKIDASEGRWLTNKIWVGICLFAILCTWNVAEHLNKTQFNTDMKIEQNTKNIELIKKDVEYLRENFEKVLNVQSRVAKYEPTSAGKDG